MLGLTGVIDIELRSLVSPTPPLIPVLLPPHVVTIRAQTPKKNVDKKNLLFFTGKFTKKLTNFRFLLKRIFKSVLLTIITTTFPKANKASSKRHKIKDDKYWSAVFRVRGGGTWTNPPWGKIGRPS